MDTVTKNNLGKTIIPTNPEGKKNSGVLPVLFSRDAYKSFERGWLAVDVNKERYEQRKDIGAEPVALASLTSQSGWKDRV